MSSDKKIRINLGSFDLLKGIGMLTVIFCHMQLNYPVDEVPLLSPLYVFSNVVSSGLMPMFFIISGFGVKEKPTDKMLKKTFSESFSALLVSLGAFAMLVSFAYYPVLKYVPSRWIGESVRKVFSWLLAVPTPVQILSLEIFPIGALWFLIALFWSQNILNQIVKIKNLCGQIVGVCLSFFIGMFLLSANFTVYCIPQGLIAVTFCYIGYILKKTSFLEKNIYKMWPYFIMVPVCLAHFILVGRKGGLAFDLASGRFGVFDFIAATLSGLLFVFLGVLGGRYTWKGIDWIKNVGVHTYWILCIHSIEQLGIPWYEIVEEGGRGYRSFCIEVFIKLIIILTGCMMLKKYSQYKYMKKRMRRNERI